MGAAVTGPCIDRPRSVDQQVDKTSGRGHIARPWAALIFATGLAGLTSTLAAQNLAGEDPTFTSHPSYRQQSVTAGTPLPVQKAEAEMVDTTLAYEELSLVANASTKRGPEAQTTPDRDLPESAEVESNGREVAATPRRIQYVVSLNVRGVYDDNINISNTDRQADFFTVIEPRLTIGFGDVLSRQDNFVALSYFPSAFIFADHDENNALQHVIRVEGQYRFPRLTLDLLEDVRLLDGSDLGSAVGTSTTSSAGRVNLDVAARTRVKVYNTSLDGNYSLTGKIFLTGDLSYSVTDYSTLIDSSVISANAYINYNYSPKLAIGVGLTGGYDVVGSPSQDQLFEQLNARASYELTGKVSATATAGVELRQYSGAGGGDSASPVFDASLLYQPFDGTNIALTISRRTLNSATLAGEDYYSTELMLGVQQRLLQRFFLGLAAGYQNSTYFSTVSGISPTRDDNYYFIEPSVDFNITRFWSLGVYYLHRENSSSLSIFSFYDNQLGARTAFSF